MIYGIGIDLVEIKRIQKVVDKQARFPERILTGKELDLYQKKSPRRKLEFLAGRFAAKEAFSKAMGTGIGKTVNFQNVSILTGKKGQPEVVESPFEGNVFLSITHTEDYAAAYVVLENEIN